MNLKKKKKGFTLIELMAVIAIIAILAAVLVPTVTGYIERSKKTAVISQVSNFVTALEAYNATATSPVATNSSDTVATVQTKLEAAGLATDGDTKEFNKIQSVKVSEAYAINNDQEAVNNIKVKQNGEFESYNSTPASPASPS